MDLLDFLASLPLKSNFPNFGCRRAKFSSSCVNFFSPKRCAKHKCCCLTDSAISRNSPAPWPRKLDSHTAGSAARSFAGDLRAAGNLACSAKGEFNHIGSMMRFAESGAPYGYSGGAHPTLCFASSDSARAPVGARRNYPVVWRAFFRLPPVACTAPFLRGQLSGRCIF